MSFLGLGDRVDSEVVPILSRLEHWTPQLCFAGIEEQELARADAGGSWSGSLLFTQATEDGRLGTVVTAGAHFAVITLELTPPIGQPVLLTRLSFADGKEYFDRRHTKKSPRTVRFLREYVRRLALPELDDLSRKRATDAERDATQREVLRERYLK